MTLTLVAPWNAVTPLMLEGACLAANCNPRPCPPETWLAPLWENLPPKAVVDEISEHFQRQFGLIQRGEYVWCVDDKQGLLELAHGFLAVWSVIEPTWQAVAVPDAILSVLSNVHLGMYLAVDEVETLAQMSHAGVDELPNVDVMLASLPMLLPELVLAADELHQGSKAVAINPYKDVGRNDACPCGSGRKFKQCCGDA
ncbi:YecA family protein [Thaumasiovibrio sp. DFM-14]|uniref:YecA family protein n=1 Tax=Thaumasiovibrio sp. DFM-14 TaxID=3384792 RepID=UPI0039A18F45